MEKGIVNVNQSDIESIKTELDLIKNILLSKTAGQMSLEEEFNSWEALSDGALEDFEESLQ